MDEEVVAEELRALGYKVTPPVRLEYERPAVVPATQVARATGRAAITVRRDLAAGRIPGFKIGGRWYVNRETLEQILRGESPGGQP